ncbi:Bestrophin, RFP-TM, chloride channel-domain-containing protein [Leucosporidium creatinivorum]|uniref:Bestrophin, RFP-TM, chloride channel-domain-containing protein n=1 Tax=Leucosporidium creatinivorum TaxID=106004 RepID=A0A1Y2G5N8_9BASI|nr:Bestrophin, RFP-TM, chloride channel-domain-containing protein [Leucosporidium creatinivorum]
MPMVSSGASSMVGILSMVTGLMVSFRSGSSYDRWYEGRRTWAALTSTSRSFLRLLAFASPPNPTTKPLQARAMNDLAQTVVAFSWATMYRLRDQPGVDHPELRALLPPSLLDAYSDIPTLPPGRRSSIDGAGKVQHSSASESTRALAALNTEPLPPSDPTSAPPSTFPSNTGAQSYKPKHRFATLPPSSTNLPLSLIRVMQALLNEFHTAKLASVGDPEADTPVLDDATFSTCIGSLNQFTEHLTALERIRDTPIPLILNIHLQALLFVYVGAVPLQLVRTLGIWCVPATAIACAVFYGVDRAAEELSDPFGTEPNDLPIAKFCQQIEAEWQEMLGTGHASQGNDWEPESLKKEE